MFTKSDNAGCYQGNLSAEAIYKICKGRNIKLLRHDYNEPCCGKDQCDRESAAAKTILRSYVDSGNDLFRPFQERRAIARVRAHTRLECLRRAIHSTRKYINDII